MGLEKFPLWRNDYVSADELNPPFLTRSSNLLDLDPVLVQPFLVLPQHRIREDRGEGTLGVLGHELPHHPSNRTEGDGSNYKSEPLQELKRPRHQGWIS